MIRVEKVLCSQPSWGLGAGWKVIPVTRSALRCYFKPVLAPKFAEAARKLRGSYAEAESSLARPQHTRMGTSGCLTAERVLLPKKKCLSARMHKQIKYHPFFSTIKVNQFPSMLNQFVDFMRSWLSRKLRGSRINFPTIRGS